ncbi:hypothetical protein S245_055208, partial [Arachis hypogaea]
MVRKFKPPLMKLLESDNIDLCFANKDVAISMEVLERMLQFYEVKLCLRKKTRMMFSEGR